MAFDERLAFGLAQGAPAAPGPFYAGADAKGAAAADAPKTSPNGVLSLEGLQILVVEDEFLLAMEVEATLLSFGCSVVGPFAKLAKALDAARRTPLDCAVLDINLNGDMVYPLADLLQTQSIPFVFLTGYLASDIPERFRGFQRMQKPLHPYTLKKILLDLLRSTELPQAT
jgi:CheY-like chemotaxis protein